MSPYIPRQLPPDATDPAALEPGAMHPDVVAALANQKTASGNSLCLDCKHGVHMRAGGNRTVYCRSIADWIRHMLDECSAFELPGATGELSRSMEKAAEKKK